MSVCENCLHKTVCDKFRATGGHVMECEYLMDNYMATEIAYKNGYEKGYKDGKNASVVHAKWEKPVLINNHWYRICSNCLYSSAHGAADNKEFMPNFCSNCGAIADLK